MGTGRTPAQLIAESEGLLLDFDGPVCDVYAGSDPARIAREVAVAFNLDIDTDDPLDLIIHALENDGPVDAIHQALTETEIEAVQSATETPGIRQLIETYPGPIAVVSNNADEAIDAWLTEAGLRVRIDVIVGRDPRHMKPDPLSLAAASKAIHRVLAHCVFVGDSLTDAEAAERAGTSIIALASSPAKRAGFEARYCTAVITGIEELTDAANRAG